MYNMILGPLGQQFWAGGGPDNPDHPIPRARFHMDWSRVVFPNAAQVDPLFAFSYAIGEQQPAAITAAIGATQADAIDTSITKAGTLSRTCIATHLGVSIDRSCTMEGADIQATLAGSVRIGIPRLLVRVFWAERTNEESVGLLEDYPEGIGVLPTDWLDAAVYSGHFNGTPMFSSIKPLPRPLPCKGGETYFRVAFEPSVRDGGATHGVITSYSTRVYGVAPSRILPSEAPKKAIQALADLQAG